MPQTRRPSVAAVPLRKGGWAAPALAQRRPGASPDQQPTLCTPNHPLLPAAVNGQPCPRAEAVLPMREISYAWVASVQEVLSPGEAVRVAVVYVQSEPAPKVCVASEGSLLWPVHSGTRPVFAWAGRLWLYAGQGGGLGQHLWEAWWHV